ADAQILAVQVIDGHANAVVFDLDPFAVRIDTNLHARRIRIPCVGNRLGQDCSDVAIEIDAEMFEDVKIDGHLVDVGLHTRSSYIEGEFLALLSAMARANSFSTISSNSAIVFARLA